MPKPSGDGFRGSVPNIGVGGRFPCRRKQEAAIAAVSKMVADGVSAGRVRRVAQPMGMGRMGAGQVSRMCPSPDDAVADLQGRVLSDVKYLHVRLDATYVKRGDSGRVRSTAPVTAVGRAVEGAEANASAPVYEGTDAEHAAAIVALVAADNPAAGRKAA